MIPRKIFLSILILTLSSLACGITINLPVRQFQAGSTITEDINVPLPDTSETIDLKITFGAGELDIKSGAQDGLIQGSARYNVEDLKPEYTIEGNSVLLETGTLDIEGIPRFGNDLVNEWDLRLSDTPLNLEINAGAYKSQIDLGGASIASLSVADGASDVEMRFSSPNLIPMSTLRYQTGASSVELSQLANANFDTMVFKAGAGDYKLDFSGELKRDATVTIDAGLSSISINVPPGMQARLFYDGGLANVDLSGDWEKSGNDYSLPGTGPRLTINVNIGAGSLELRNR